MPQDMAALAENVKTTQQEIQNAAALSEEQSRRLQGELYKIKQTVNLVAGARPAGKKIKAVFLIHHIEAWDSLADIYEAMLVAEDFAPLAVSIRRRFPGEQNYGFENIIHRKLSELGIEHLRFSMEDSFDGLDILKALAPDIIFRQSQWDWDIPPGFHVEELRFARLCYVPYAVTAVADTRLLAKERDPATDSDFHRTAWKIFYATEDQKTRFKKHAVRYAQNMEIVGHPKVKRLIRLGREQEHWPIKQQISGRRFRLIWSPHHSVGKEWLRFGLFPAIYQDMLAWVKSDNSIEMVLSFHPAAISKITEAGGPLSSEEMAAFLQEWDSLPNTARHSAGNYAGLMQASDCMLTDGISFLAEYQFFTKPVIFLERADHLPFSPAGERIIAGTHPVKTVAEAKKLVHDFAAGCVDVKAQVQRDNTAWLAGEKLAAGTAAERILRSIRRGIREEERP
ncbi:MAG: hypothetical protein DU429_03340 [Candidatus Tokpelaia sp.]|nr:MAG: hypothetical protein DU430_01205 [Candidatus Tokpelaia sp.]KAA6207148.1 MAG: hypothetical protein DU429_03340 [Candidatus Tokpelaia sp.]